MLVYMKTVWAFRALYGPIKRGLCETPIQSVIIGNKTLYIGSFKKPPYRGDFIRPLYRSFVQPL